MKQYSYTLPVRTKKEEEFNSLIIEKTEEIQQKLSVYKNTHSLSASRIKDYITCPLKFYFNTVVGIKKPNEINEKDEAALLGRIYHHAMEKYYEKRNIPDKKISIDEIKDIVNYAFEKESRESKKQINTSGFNALTYNIVCQFIKNTIQFDLKRINPERIEYNDFDGVDSEVELHAKIQDVNFVAFVDRIDYGKNNNIINIIDYKTTLSKSLTKVKILDIFTSHKSEFHEVFQVLLYCYIHSIDRHNESNILIPYLYKIYDFSKPNTKLSTFKILIPNELQDSQNMPSFDIDINSIDNSKENSTEVDITNYKKVSVAFEWLMNKILYDIYNPSLPFSCNPLDKDHVACKYCPYQTICKKDIKH
jgi:ATP-dependent helicase/DNAse subunit B